MKKLSTSPLAGSIRSNTNESGHRFVSVKQADAWIQSHREATESGLSLEDRVEVVKHRVSWRDGPMVLICPPKTRPSPVLEFGRVKTRKGRAQWPHQRG